MSMAIENMTLSEREAGASPSAGSGATRLLRLRCGSSDSPLAPAPSWLWPDDSVRPSTALADLGLVALRS